jgi:hypothetical protein
MTLSADTIPLLVTLGFPGGDSFNLRFPPEYSEEILSLLDDNGVDHNTALEMSAGPDEWIEVVNVLGVGVSSAGGLAGLAAVIKAFVHRHDGKRFVLKRGKYEIEAAGYSEKQIKQFLEKIQGEQAERDAAMDNVLGRGLDEEN